MRTINEIRYIHNEVVTLKEHSFRNVDSHISNLLIEIIERLDAMNNRDQEMYLYIVERNSRLDRIYNDPIEHAIEQDQKHAEDVLRNLGLDPIEQAEADSASTVNVAGEPIYRDSFSYEDDEF